MDILWVIGMVVALLVTVVLAIVVFNLINTVFTAEEDWYDLDFSDDE